MGNFIKFIRESGEKHTGENPRAMADGFIHMYNRLTKRVYLFLEKQVFTNVYGDMVGYLYINRMAGLRMNFKNGVLHSFSKWSSYNRSKGPETTIIISDVKYKTREGLMSISNELNKSLESEPPKTVSTAYKYCGRNFATLADLIVDSYFKYHRSLTKLLADVESAGLDVNYAIDILQKAAILMGYRVDIKAIYEKEKDSSPIVRSDATPREVSDVPFDAVEGELEDACTENTEVYANVEETVAEPKESRFEDEELIAQITADPLPVFRQLNSYVLTTAQRINNALLITGQGGVGKSYNVNKILSTFGTEGTDYVIMKGNCTPVAMYKFLYDHYNKIVVFDDCDSVLSDDVGLNILKGALDSGRTRKISWNSNRANVVNTFGCKDHDEIEAKLAEWSAANKGKPCLPSTFTFQGGCIFISNMSAEKMAQGKAAALLTRCMMVDIKLLASEVILRMESCLPNIKVYNMDGIDITDENIKKEVFDWISSKEYLEDPRIANKEISFRLFNKVYMFRYAKLPMWKELSFCI